MSDTDSTIPGAQMSPAAHVTWSIAARIVSVLLGVGILGWPIFSFGAIFMLDAPMRGLLDEVQRYSFVLLTWFYPVLYGVAWAWYKRLRARPIAEYQRMMVWFIPAIAPFYYVWFFSRPE